MRIKYSKHIETMNAIRKIENDLPRGAFERAEERFIDAKTGHDIAVMETTICGL